MNSQYFVLCFDENNSLQYMKSSSSLFSSVPSSGNKKPSWWHLERDVTSGYACGHDAELCGHGQICFWSKLTSAGEGTGSLASQPEQAHTIAYPVAEAGARIFAFKGSWFISYHFCSNFSLYTTGRCPGFTLSWVPRVRDWLFWPRVSG